MCAEAKHSSKPSLLFRQFAHIRLIKEIINEDNLQIIIGDGMLVSGNISWATVCANSTGVAEDEHYDLKYL